MTRRAHSLAWLLVALLAATMFFINPLAETAAGFSREVTLGSGALYGTLRVANSLMSVAKDADVTGGVGVASVTASPGQLLQPVTNTIDRMADLLFYLAIASGILSLVLAPVAKVASAVLALGAGAIAILLFKARSVPPALDRFSRSAAAIGLLGAVLLPASYSLAFHAGNAITEEAWSEASAIFQRMDAQYEATAVESQVEALREGLPADGTAPPPVEDEGLLGRLGSAVDASRSALSGTLDAASGLAQSVTGGVTANARIITEGLALSADLFTASIGIAVAYLVKLLVLPMLILGALIYLMRALVR
nr:hypothetical protein RKHAN_00979 [Rhizobium sp. Khangiran2]